ncbi:sensor histidine kinase [Leptothrix discophora]|uniref:histidine kinase n=1 Tax=Leptothrix discophora TaxID=89 RepID=A0ABT9FY37_LEPDI|nr:ATP-binding protein [Leptothrix discophora]MDP4299149.1 ATP-binding protein [Leptothrix discophora]
MSATNRSGSAWRTALAGTLGLLLTCTAAVQVGLSLGPSWAIAGVCGVLGGLALRIAFQRTGPGSDGLQGDTSVASPLPVRTTAGVAAETVPPNAQAQTQALTRAADHERLLLRRLPGRTLLLQRVVDGPLTDWLVLAMHDPAEASPAGSSDDPAAPRPELLSHWLVRHPEVRPADVVASLQEAVDAHQQAAAPGTWSALPLAVDRHVLWQRPALPVAAPASAEADGSAHSAQDRESLVYTVTHDLKAPIRVIEGFTRIVREDYGHLLDRIGNDHLDRVLGAVDRMKGMIEALLALSRLSSAPLVRQPVDLSTMASTVIEELRAQEPQRRVIVDLEPGLLARGDASLLRTVFDNLLGNAWKYSGKRDVARIEFGSTRLKAVRPETPESQDRPVYYVRDNGAGFDLRFAERLFKPFQRLHSASEFAGSGVGLASVRRIVLRHGGEIWAQATVDQGACFFFTLS